MNTKTDQYTLRQSLSFVIVITVSHCNQSLTFMFVNLHRNQGNQHRWAEKKLFLKILFLCYHEVTLMAWFHLHNNFLWLDSSRMIGVEGVIYFLSTGGNYCKTTNVECLTWLWLTLISWYSIRNVIKISLKANVWWKFNCNFMQITIGLLRFRLGNV